MNKLWPILFLLVPFMGVGLFVAAPFCGWWLPESVSTFAEGGIFQNVDLLFYVILIITGIAFLLTELALFAFLWKYRADNKPEGLYIHGNHRAEMTWTIVPALILVFIAVVQIPSWSGIKMKARKMEEEPIAHVLAGQFEWRMIYPGRDGTFDTPDDIHSINDLHVPVGSDVKILLKSRDVLHSFFVPQFRVKQDAVPGLDIPVWWRVDRPGEYELACAELCGWGHYTMKGRVKVESRAEFDTWIEAKIAEHEEVQ